MVIAISVAIFLYVVPSHIEKSRNQISSLQLEFEVPSHIKSLHESLLIADLHADSLLWDRDLSKKANYGHADIPRLIEGNVALQVFSVVTKSPKNLNIHQNADDSDNITWLSIAQAWPPKTWFRLHARAQYQAEKLNQIAKLQSDTFFLITNQQDLKRYLKLRAKNQKIIAGVLSLEGAHVLEGKLEHLEQLYASGFRMLGLSHFFDNKVGGSAHGLKKAGLTGFGKQVLARANQLNLIIDLAHASPMLVQDVIQFYSGPILVSHTGVQKTCPSPRNLSDKQIKQIAQKNGLIGIGFWPGATCSQDIQGIVRAIQHVTKLVGIEYVALGSDFDGNVTVPFTAEHMQQLTHALFVSAYSEKQIRKIMGENIINFLLANLPKNY